MKPYYQEGGVTIYLGDCREILPQLDKVDLVICDLPQGITQNQWDNTIPLNELWSSYRQVIKDNGAIVLFSNQPYTSELVVGARDIFRYSLVWQKNKFSNFLDAKRKIMRIHEDILVFYKSQPTYNPQYTCGTPYRR